MYKRIAKKILKDTIYFLMNGPLEKPSEREAELIRELRTNLGEDLVPSKANSKAERLWIEFENEVRWLIRNKDPRKLLRWNVIRRTMFVDSASYIRKEFSYLRTNNWDNLWKNAITETKVGCPAPFLGYIRSSENLIHHAYLLARFQDQTKEKISDTDLVLSSMVATEACAG